MRTNLIIYLFIFILFSQGCKLGTGPVGASYNNITAHYNAYFIANERMIEIESSLHDKYQWNYNKILPIYIPIDSNDAKTVETQIEDCIEKASIAIQRHPNSRWEDDSYILVGKARYYSLEYADAIETYKYVNKHGNDDAARHEALIELIKTFVDFNEINNAIAVSDFLKKEQLNNKNLRELSKVRAYLYQKRKDLDQTVQNLVIAEALMTKGPKRARINFIVGQVYQQLGFEAEAYNYYQQCLKNNPSYELSFYAKLNMAQVSQLTASGDLKKIRKYFKKLLKDPKNLEYKDKIYYEMARFELKKGDLEQAIDYFEESIQSSVKNQRQKAYSYLSLGSIYYDSLRNFELAQAYYDSTVQIMPKDEENFDKIKKRQEILDEFIKQLTIVRTNDSLINLSKLPIDSLISIAKAEIAQQELKEKEKLEKQKKRDEIAMRQASVFDQQGGSLINTSIGEGANWYFYSPAIVSKGIAEFKRKWGNRPLEDNWRILTKSGENQEEIIEGDSKENEEPVIELTEEEAQDQKVNDLISNIPQTEDEVNQLLSEVDEALYQLGNIYNFNLEEKSNAIETFESELTRFPDSEHIPEVLYQLYLLYKPDFASIAEIKANELKEKYPESIYAKLIDNPNYREESHAATEQLKKIYTQAYALHKSGDYKGSKMLADSALQAFPENKFGDHLALLNVLNMGEMDGQVKYEFELNNFIKTYPDSELLEYANQLVEASESYQINLYNSAKAKFIKYFDQKHYMVIIYANKDELANQITNEVDEYLNSNNFKLSTGNLVLDENNAMLLINEFPGKTSANAFFKLFSNEMSLNEKHKGEKIHSFVITEDNFDIFYKTKDISAYLNFFDNQY